MGHTLLTAKRMAQLQSNVGTGNVTPQMWVDLVNEAVRYIYDQVVKVEPANFATVTSITYPANTEYIDLSSASYLNTNPVKILSLYNTDVSGAVTTSNKVQSEITPMSESEKGRLLQGFTNGADTEPYHYGITGKANMHIAPTPTEALPIRISYVPAAPTLTTSDDSTALFGGLAPDRYHDAVVDRVVMRLAQRGNNLNSATAQLYADSMDFLKQSTSRTSDEPRHTHRKRRIFGGR